MQCCESSFSDNCSLGSAGLQLSVPGKSDRGEEEGTEDRKVAGVGLYTLTMHDDSR